MSKNVIIKHFTIVISVTIIIVALWTFIIVPEYEQLPPNFTLNMEYEGKDQIVNNVNGELSEPYVLKDILSQKAISVNDNILTISSTVTGMRADTGEIVFQDNQKYDVDRITLMHSDKPNKRFGFLPGVKKQDYDFLHPLIFDNSVLVFQGTDKINDLEVYKFSVKSLEHDVSSAFPSFSSHTIWADTYATLWIEPITGDMLRFEKSWDNYLVEEGLHKNTIEKGWKHTTAFTESILTQNAKTKIVNLNFSKVIMPVFLASISLGLGSVLILWFRLTTIRKKNDQLSLLGNLTARIAHDLKNPLSVIKSDLAMMSLQEKENPDEKMEQRIKRLQRTVNRMEHQIAGVMDFVRKKPLTFGRFSSRELIETALESITIPENIKILTPAHDVVIIGDLIQLGVVLSNIITNSIQAIGTSGEISILMEDNPDYVIISIIDSGPGIPEKDLPKIFDLLFTTKQTGTGLGLFSCKTIIENHGGSISVKNNPATFTILLPKKQTKTN
ncbi:MAG: DUF3068 domain-containing protein [Thaumarchaeota archaeon]|nr:DUF3068 domain-containing protein [Nitrososphaerota archaeon]